MVYIDTSCTQFLILKALADEKQDFVKPWKDIITKQVVNNLKSIKQSLQSSPGAHESMISIIDFFNSDRVPWMRNKLSDTEMSLRQIEIVVEEVGMVLKMVSDGVEGVVSIDSV